VDFMELLDEFDGLVTDAASDAFEATQRLLAIPSQLNEGRSTMRRLSERVRGHSAGVPVSLLLEKTSSSVEALVKKHGDVSKLLVSFYDEILALSTVLDEELRPLVEEMGGGSE